MTRVTLLSLTQQTFATSTHLLTDTRLPHGDPLSTLSTSPSLSRIGLSEKRKNRKRKGKRKKETLLFPQPRRRTTTYTKPQNTTSPWFNGRALNIIPCLLFLFYLSRNLSTFSLCCYGRFWLIFKEQRLWKKRHRQKMRRIVVEAWVRKAWETTCIV